MSPTGGARGWRDLDRVGWMPWTLIHVMALLGAVVTTALAIKG